MEAAREALKKLEADALLEAVPELIEGLAHPSPTIRDDVAALLGRVGLRALPPLIDALDSKDASIRAGAAQAIGRMGTSARAAAPRLLRALKDSDPSTRASALASLMGILRAETAVPHARHALQDKDAQVRAMAALLLGNLGAEARGVIPALAKASKDGNAEVRMHAVYSLAQVGPASAVLSSLRAALGDTDGHVRRAAIWGLGQLGRPTKEVASDVARLLADNDANVRYEAARYLGRAGPSVLPVLLQALRSKDSTVRKSACLAVSRMVQEPEHVEVMLLEPEPASSLIPVIVALLADKDKWVRHSAARTLGSFGRAAGEKAVPSLTTALEDPERWVRWAALESLLRIRPSDKGPMRRFVGELTHTDATVRRDAIWVLGQMGAAGASAAPALMRILAKDSDSALRADAAHALGIIGRVAGDKAVQQLVKSLQEDESAAVRAKAAWALGDIKLIVHGVVPALRAASKARDLRVRGAALYALQQIADPGEGR